MAKSKLTNPILNRVLEISPSYLDDIDVDSAPTSPQEFLEWWWSNYAVACEKCPLFESRNQVVKPDGVAPSPIMVLGEGPGFLEDITGFCMVGPNELLGSHCNKCDRLFECAGHKILDKPNSRMGKNKLVSCSPKYLDHLVLTEKFFIRSAGSIVDGLLIDSWKFNFPRNNWIETHNLINRTDQWTHSSPFFISNAVLCRSFDASTLSDTSPSNLATSTCRKHLAFQWAACNPKIIISMGRVNLGSLLRSQKKADDVQQGDVIETKFGPVVFTNHPAFYMREPNENNKAIGYAKIKKVFEYALDYVGLL